MASIYKKPVFVRDPKTGRKTKAKSKKWWGRFRDVDGGEKQVPLAVDRAAAQAMLSELVRRVERERVGLIEPHDEQAKRPLSKHLADYRRYLESKRNAASHVRLTASYIQKVLDGCKFKLVRDLSPSRVSRWLADLRAKGRSVRTSNAYLIAIKSFSRWIVRERRAKEDALSHLQRLNAETDVRRRRRVLTPDELDRLVAAAQKSGDRLGRMRGQDRAIVYRLAAFTGLRAQEIASLTPRSFDLDADPPTVTVEACYSKHRRKDMLPLEADLCERLRAYLENRQTGLRGAAEERLWPGKWYRKAGRILQRDLAAARKAWIDEAETPQEQEQRGQSDYLRDTNAAGHVVDFHSLRHGFITYLVTANVAPKVTQALARHSTITLTMDRYTHLGVGDLVDALKRLPAMGNGNCAAAKSEPARGTNSQR
jgi:site-specific recombinase XerD